MLQERSRLHDPAMPYEYGMLFILVSVSLSTIGFFGSEGLQMLPSQSIHNDVILEAIIKLIYIKFV